MSRYNGLFRNLMPELYSPDRSNDDRRNHSNNWSTPERHEANNRGSLNNSSDFNNSNSGQYTFNSNQRENSSSISSSRSSTDDSNNSAGPDGSSSWLQNDYASDRKYDNQNSLSYTRYRLPSDEKIKRDRLNTYFRI
ncbi:putative uncharacterized protein DDB_G0283431 [Chironomus tepperi]|uniref:putative uncharacterized protein DDB_G0283431 n=1 Tax=Chironomus tepperi TaxID=113505 RepID=UPI00391F6C44